MGYYLEPAEAAVAFSSSESTVSLAIMRLCYMERLS